MSKIKDALDALAVPQWMRDDVVMHTPQSQDVESAELFPAGPGPYNRAKVIFRRCQVVRWRLMINVNTGTIEWFESGPEFSATDIMLTDIGASGPDFDALEDAVAAKALELGESEAETRRRWMMIGLKVSPPE